MTAPTPEGGCDHLATKDDFDDIHAVFERFRADFKRWLIWQGIAIVGASALIAAAAVAFLKLTA